jgi:hypothetical protein
LPAADGCVLDGFVVDGCVADDCGLPAFVALSAAEQVKEAKSIIKINATNPFDFRMIDHDTKAAGDSRGSQRLSFGTLTVLRDAARAAILR